MMAVAISPQKSCAAIAARTFVPRSRLDRMGALYSKRGCDRFQATVRQLSSLTQNVIESQIIFRLRSNLPQNRLRHTFGQQHSDHQKRQRKLKHSVRFQSKSPRSGSAIPNSNLNRAFLITHPTILDSILNKSTTDQEMQRSQSSTKF